MKMAPNLLELPPEVLHGILRNTNPQDLARLCCCRTLYDLIKNDRLLYKELYLRDFVKLSPKSSIIVIPEVLSVFRTRHLARIISHGALS